jgi:hypothetical protein
MSRETVLTLAALWLLGLTAGVTKADEWQPATAPADYAATTVQLGDQATVTPVRWGGYRPGGGYYSYYAPRPYRYYTYYPRPYVYAYPYSTYVYPGGYGYPTPYSSYYYPYSSFYRGPRVSFGFGY